MTTLAHTFQSSSNAPETAVATPLRVIIADDHALFRDGLRSALEVRGGISVVAEIARLDDIVPVLDTHDCDVLLLDLQMDRNAIAEIRSFSERVSVAVVTASEEPEELVAAVRAGARAVFFKTFPITSLIEALRTVASGNVWLPPSLQTYIANELQHPGIEALTAREREIVRYVALGLHNAEVAKKAFISEQTVKTHLKNIFQKLGVRDRVALAMYAARVGLVGVRERST
jgi:DNA-binding NarL/FixJ family response regulator